MIGSFIWIALVIALQSGLFYLFVYLGIPALPATLAVDFITAFIFTAFRFKGNMRGWYKNPYFMKVFAIYLLLFAAFSLLSYFVF